MNDTFNLQLLSAELITDEGRRLQAYLDTGGLVTIGIGRELTHHGISYGECDYLFNNDVLACCLVMDREIPWWRDLPPNAQRCMINMCFMGWGSFSQFKQFFAAMQAHDFQRAAAEIRNSAWYHQVRLRGPRVVQRLLASP